MFGQVTSVRSIFILCYDTVQLSLGELRDVLGQLRILTHSNDKRLEAIQKENAKQLEKMSNTLEKRLEKVLKRLEQIERRQGRNRVVAHRRPISHRGLSRVC